MLMQAERITQTAYANRRGRRTWRVQTAAQARAEGGWTEPNVR